ncbi:transposase [Desulfurispira natronophila]|uniref:transposase n=1 Tax=Desulfurispira natronophila TaxID=682562 RepID=UPI0016213AEE|nr:transposase [Desulfurispira natronophila]
MSTHKSYSTESYYISDELWAKIEPLIPPAKAKKKPGRPRMDDRMVMEAIFHVFISGCAWKSLPRSFGAPSTIHERYQEWKRQGVLRDLWLCGILTSRALNNNRRAS